MVSVAFSNLAPAVVHLTEQDTCRDSQQVLCFWVNFFSGVDVYEILKIT